MTFETFIETGWNDHVDHTPEVAERLAQSLAMIQAPAHVAPYARLVAHVYGEHLGEWARGVAVLEAIGALPAATSTNEAAVLARNVAVLRYGAGDRTAAAHLDRDDRIVALATAASALVARKAYREALVAYEAALHEAEAGEIAAGSPVLRALAVGGNNLATELETKPTRDADETRGMLVAADAGVRYWQRAGTWLEEERAYYRLARSQLAAGDATAATASAQRCLDVCDAHEAPAFERFFAYAALTLALRAAQQPAEAAAARAQALAAYEQVPEGERPHCASDLAALGT